jgi:hypothetical protein
LDFISAITSWLAFHSIYGILAAAAAAYCLAYGLKRLVPSCPDPFIPAAQVFVVALCTVPSIPRYLFERKTLADIERKHWIRIVNTTRVGDLTEPLTWYWTPIGSFFLVMPDDPIQGGFRELLLQFDEDSQVRIVDPDCADKTIMVSAPDNDGVIRYISKEPQQMTGQELSMYCEYDWSIEIEALRAGFLKDYKP